MARARILEAGIGLISLIVVLGALSIASAVFTPVAFALFLIALLWSLQKRLQAQMPRLLALAASTLVLGAVFVAFGSLIAWGLGRVARWVIANMGRFRRSMTALYPRSRNRGSRLRACGRTTST